MNRPKLARFSLSSCLAAAIVAATPATAQETGNVHLPRQPLAQAVRKLALALHANILADSALIGTRVGQPLDGDYTVEQALSALLRDTGLVFERVEGGYVIRAEDPPAATNAGDVVVTGSRIRGAGSAGAELITLDRRAIDRSGYATTQQVLQTLPQNFAGGPNDTSLGISIRNGATTNLGQGSSINLRGLGPTSTLVLIDGNRLALGGVFGSFTDVSVIPTSAIDRVEILGDGASAIYGSDAVAGVVNLRLRNDFKGAETRARFGVGNGFTDAQFSQLIGVAWHGGHAVFGYEYYQHTRLAAADRRYATEDLRPFGGPDYRKTFSNPGTIIAADGSVFAIPAGQDGTSLTPAQLIPGAANLYDLWRDADLLPYQRRHSFYGVVTQELSTDLTVFTQAFYARRYSRRREVPDSLVGLSVPPSNPYYVDPIGTAEPVTVNYLFVDDLGPQTAASRVQTFSGVAGADLQLGRWSAAVRGTYSTQQENFHLTGVPNYPALDVALADPDPASAFNPLGDGARTPAATIDKVRGFIDVPGRFRLWSGGLKLDGPLIDVPAGSIKLAIGGEVRREHYASITIDDEYSATPIRLPTDGLPISRTIAAIYGELLVPIIAPDEHIPGVTKLDLSLAGRLEHYSGIGSTTNPKVGLRWEPAAGVALRATYGTSFRAPGFQDVRQGPGTALYIPIPIPDPAASSGTSNALILFGNRPGIGPEKATTWTIGADVAPAFLPGLRLTGTYFDIRYRDRIANIAIDFQTFLTERERYASIITDHPSAGAVAAVYADPVFSNPYGIDASAVDVLIDGRTANLAAQHENGVDLDLGYSLTRGDLKAELGVSGTYLFGVKQKIAASAPTADVVSTSGYPVDLRLRGRAIASVGRWSVSSFLNYVDHYRNTAVIPPEHVRSWATVDLQLGYDFAERDDVLAGMRLSLSVTNFFNRAPPYVNNLTPYTVVGYDGDNADPTGRVIAFQVVKSW